MIFEKVWEMVEEGNEVGRGEENGGKEVEVSMTVVSMVEDRISEVGIQDVLIKDVQ